MTEHRSELFDLGYQHYDGPRRGRTGAVRALWTNGIRSVLGLGRGSRAKVLPGLLFLGVMIPALVIVFGENQHLYQAAAMICNFFVGTGALVVHKKADVLVVDVVKWLIPSAAAGIIIGVAVSNSRLFAGERSCYLAHLVGAFLIYVVVYNCLRFGRGRGGADGLDMSGVKRSAVLTILCGVLSGVPAGLLGLGGGVVCVPLQQLLLKMPLKRAASNSAATIASIALIGAFYKNATLGQHGIAVGESLKMAAFIIPGAVFGAYLGGHMMHKLPTRVVRIVFVLIAAIASYKMLRV